MLRKLAIATISACSVAGTAYAEPPQDPNVGGQLNQCWGQISHQLAQLGVDGDGLNGGSHGLHSRSTQAADINGGFANSDNIFGIQFNVDGGRTGVGNVSREDHGAPGDGGNGQHALDNAALTVLINPYSGEATTANGGTADVEVLTCDTSKINSK